MNPLRSIVAAVGLASFRRLRRRAASRAAPAPRALARARHRAGIVAPPAASAARLRAGPALSLPQGGVVRATSGLEVATIPSKALPIVQLRVVVGGGKAADGEKPGLSSITASLLEEGGAGSMSSRDLITRIESLGACFSIDTGFDATVLARRHPRSPRRGDGPARRRRHSPYGARQSQKLKKRWSSRLTDAARQSGAWAAQMVLFGDPSSRSRASSTRTRPSPRPPRTSARSRSPTAAPSTRSSTSRENTFVVVAGDTTPEAARAAVAKPFAAYAGGDAPTISFTDPNQPEVRKITVVDWPRSTQSDIFVAAPWPRAHRQALGRGRRVEPDPRRRRGRPALPRPGQERSLADATRSASPSFATGPPSGAPTPPRRPRRRASRSRPCSSTSVGSPPPRPPRPRSPTPRATSSTPRR